MSVQLGITPVQAYIKIYEEINPTCQLTKIVDKSRANVGDVLSYTPVLTNTGILSASVVVQDSANCPDFSCCPFIVEEQNTVGCFPVAVIRLDKPVVSPNSGSALYIGNSLGNFFAIDVIIGAF